LLSQSKESGGRQQEELGQQPTHPTPSTEKAHISNEGREEKERGKTTETLTGSQGVVSI
jgi:hypothetical protein